MGGQQRRGEGAVEQGEQVVEQGWGLLGCGIRLCSGVVGGPICARPAGFRRCPIHQAGAYWATATMARRTLELVCKDQGAAGSNLAKKTEWLEQDNKIEGRLLDWATALRFVGNDGTHGDAEVKRQDAEDALVFTEALLEHIYVLTVQYEKFSERRQKRAAKKSAPAPQSPAAQN
ncbi:DUF4145 domain-containing protein [Streptomyces sp. NPDC048111]|uniref:DUF4145 domain-containing protein n=1 Tax=Streptomyces sp. NPDC048111 TaxID=3365500 RepID=UPI0037153ED6